MINTKHSGLTPTERLRLLVITHYFRDPSL